MNATAERATPKILISMRQRVASDNFTEHIAKGTAERMIFEEMGSRRSENC